MDKNIDQSVVNYLEGEIARLNEPLKNLRVSIRKKWQEKKEDAESFNTIHPKYRETIYLRDFYFDLLGGIERILLSRRINEVALISTMSEEEVRRLTNDMESDLNHLKRQLYKSICEVAKQRIEVGRGFEAYAKIQFDHFNQDIRSFQYSMRNNVVIALREIVLDLDRVEALANIAMHYANGKFVMDSGYLEEVRKLIKTSLTDEEISELLFKASGGVESIRKSVVYNYIPTVVVDNLNAAQVRADENKKQASAQKK